jgi:hypothetical protein
MAVQGFRTFRERVVVPFRAGRRPAEPIAVIHGESSSGKSNLLAALTAFFRGAGLCLATPSCSHDVPLADPSAPASPITWRDRFRIDLPTEIDVRFVDARLVYLRLTATPVAGDLHLELSYLPPNDAPAPGHPWPADKMKPLSDELRAWLATWLHEPLGTASRPIAVLRACHVAAGFRLGVPDGPYPLPPFGEELYRQRTSLDPRVRDLWHRFIVAVRGLPPFEHRDVSVERLEGGPAEMVVEDRGRVVLRFAELSSSEQQALTLAAFSFLCRAALLVIEYPETHLDAAMKTALLTLLQRRIDAGRIDQVFLETHETQFDGPTVLRTFRRGDGASDAVRGPSVGEAPSDIDRKSREQGAKQGWVTREGYTQIPDAMREELQLALGGHVWFLKGKKRWEAWPGKELEALFPNEDTEDREPE